MEDQRREAEDAYQSSLLEYRVYLQSAPAADHLALMKVRLEGIRDHLETADSESFRSWQGQAAATRSMIDHLFNTIPAELQAQAEEQEAGRRQERE